MSNIVIQGFPNSGAYTKDDLRGYKVYTALLTQTGTDAPVATVVENTIGDIVWTRNADGEYTGTLTNAFTIDKTLCFITVTSGGGFDNAQIVQGPGQSDFVLIITYNNGVLTDELLSMTPFEIRVYP